MDQDWAFSPLFLYICRLSGKGEGYQELRGEEGEGLKGLFSGLIL